MDGSTHNYSATATDTAGNTSAPSAAFIAKIDVTPPVAPVIWAIVTNLKSPADAIDCPDMDMDDQGDPAINLTGTAEPNAIVSVKDGVLPLGTTLADATGNWSIKDNRTVADGALLLYTATATDVAGNTGPASPAFTPTVDRAAPQRPNISGISPDTGASATDGITSATKIKLSGTAEANALVAMYEDATVLAAVIAGADGSWSFNEFRTLADGSTHNYSATATDLSGNTSFRSTIFVVKIDTKPPGRPRSQISPMPAIADRVTPTT